MAKQGNVNTGWAISANAVVEAGGSLTIPDGPGGGVTMTSDPQAKLTVHGALNATNATFTASGATGWDGITFASGASGTLDGVVIEKVGGSGAAIDIVDASPTIRDVGILFPEPGTASGIRVNGSSANPIIEGTTIQNMLGDGIRLTNQAKATLKSNTVTLAEGVGFSAGYQARAYLGQSAGETIGNIFFDGEDDGVAAHSQAFVAFSFRNRNGPSTEGFNTLEVNDGVGVSAASGATVNAGIGTSAGRNRFVLNVTQDAEASGAGSTVYARCNWWNGALPPFATATTTGGVLDDSEYLQQDPYQFPTTPCVSQTSSKGGDDVSTGRDRLVQALARAEDAPAAAAADLMRIADDHPALAASALMEVARLAVGEEFAGERLRAPSPEADALLMARLARGRDVQAVRRALLFVRHSQGNIAEALVYAEALAASGVQSDRVLGHTARAYLAAEQGEDPSEALRALDAVAPGSREAAAARADLGGEATAPREIAQPDAPALKGATPEAEVLSAVYPNPTTGVAQARITLREAAHVRAVVYDALGREVAVLQNADLLEGTHALRAEPFDWAAGRYLLSVHVTGEGGATQRYVRRFTFAR